MIMQQRVPSFPIALGCMGLTGTWNPAEMNAEREKRAIAAFEAALQAGITLYDHADIYGGGTCEEVFKKCLEAVPGSREKIVIATKGGIRPGHYNLSALYLEECIERSLRRMGIEAIDLYQLHRPDPLTHPSETATALNKALKTQKILSVGVSNYYPEQVRALQRYLDAPLVSNQVRISLYHLDAIYEGWPTNTENTISQTGDGVLDQCMALNMTPLAYSPLGGGSIACGKENDEKQAAIQAKLKELSAKYEKIPVQIALSWLLSHPSGIIPIVGSANPAHIQEAADAAHLRLEREDWYSLWTAAWRRVP
jgi:predicted oxidoreductase